jgi:hypothetical protein
MKLASRPMMNPAVISREVLAGEAVLVNTDTAAAIALNATGLVAWRLMDGSHSLEEIVAAIRHYFKGVPDSVSDDIKTLVDTLAEEGFVGYQVLDGEQMGV